jgi:flagellar protein FlgJ
MSNMIFPASAKPIELNVNRYTSQYDRLDNYNDLNALQSIKYQSKSDKSGALDAAAKHFESIFVSMMIKSMRDANKVFSEGNMLNSSESEFYQQMFDSQLAVSLATGKGIGLADVIKRQLSKDLNTPSLAIPADGLPLSGRSSAAGGKDQSFTLENYARLPFVSAQKVDALSEVLNSVDEVLANNQPLPEAAQSAVADQPELPVHFQSPEAFIQTLYPYALEVEQQTGIDARLMLAQSALETGWGKYPILKENGAPSFNMFGIKSHGGWQGDSARITTTEYRGGIAMTEKANFRAYGNYQESFQDYARFLQSNARYQDALDYAAHPEQFAEKLQEAGYATDPSYADKINRIMERYMQDLKLPEVSVNGQLQSGSFDLSGTGQEG